MLYSIDKQNSKYEEMHSPLFTLSQSDVTEILRRKRPIWAEVVGKAIGRKKPGLDQTGKGGFE